MSEVERDLLRAADTGQPIRIHTSDGEVLVARVLNCDPEELVYIVITSSRPERYAVCDATGFSIPRHAVERTQLLKDA
jgi:hypothetical protein